jgi:hypothetical protein
MEILRAVGTSILTFKSNNCVSIGKASVSVVPTALKKVAFHYFYQHFAPPEQFSKLLVHLKMLNTVVDGVSGKGRERFMHVA